MVNASSRYEASSFPDEIRLSKEIASSFPEEIRLSKEKPSKPLGPKNGDKDQEIFRIGGAPVMVEAWSPKRNFEPPALAKRSKQSDSDVSGSSIMSIDMRDSKASAVSSLSSYGLGDDA